MVSLSEQKGVIPGIDNARKYAAKHKKYTNLMYRSVLKDIKASKISGNYLEIGAGPGFLAVMLARRDPAINITAIDISPEMVTVGNEYIRESKLENRIRYLIGDAGDEELLKALGKFNCVYSTFSLHHLKAQGKSIRNLWNAVADKGMLYIHDFKKIPWLCSLPLKGGEINSIRSSFSPQEIKDVLKDIGITDYIVKNPFPFLFQTITARK